MTSCTLLSAHLDYPIISRPTHVLYIRKCLQVYFWSRGLDLIASRGVTRDSSQTKSSLLLGPPMFFFFFFFFFFFLNPVYIPRESSDKLRSLV